MDLKLDVVVVPVRDVDKAKHVYDAGLECRLDADVSVGAGAEGRAAGPDPQGRSDGSHASFSYPDGNGWLLQEITERLSGRV
jgi:catechol 2,3-dioxygenase-like lactoylglutathione lyase family enzyme